MQDFYTWITLMGGGLRDTTRKDLPILYTSDVSASTKCSEFNGPLRTRVLIIFLSMGYILGDWYRNKGGTILDTLLTTNYT